MYTTKHLFLVIRKIQQQQWAEALLRKACEPPRMGRPPAHRPLLLDFSFIGKNTTNGADEPGVGLPNEVSATRKNLFFRAPVGVVGRTFCIAK